MRIGITMNKTGQVPRCGGSIQAGSHPIPAFASREGLREQSLQKPPPDGEAVLLNPGGTLRMPLQKPSPGEGLPETKAGALQSFPTRWKGRSIPAGQGPLDPHKASIPGTLRMFQKAIVLYEESRSSWSLGPAPDGGWFREGRNQWFFHPSRGSKCRWGRPRTGAAPPATPSAFQLPLTTTGGLQRSPTRRPPLSPGPSVPPQWLPGRPPVAPPAPDRASRTHSSVQFGGRTSPTLDRPRARRRSPP